MKNLVRGKTKFTAPLHHVLNSSHRHLIYGTGIGLIFPIVAHSLYFYTQSPWWVLRITDLAPLILGITFFLLGKKSNELDLEKSDFSRLAVSLCSEGILGLDSTQKIIFSNASAFQLSGYNAEQLIGKSVTEVFELSNPTELDPTQIDLTQFDSNHSSNLEGNRTVWLKTKGGARLQVELRFTKTPAHLSHNSRYFLITFVDISHKVDSENRLNSLADFVRFNPNPILKFSNDCRLDYANDACMPILVHLGISVTETVHGEWASIINRILTEGVYEEIELTEVGMTFHVTFVPHVADQTVFVFARDITREKEIAIEKQALQRREAIAAMITTYNHEIRNPLTIAMFNLPRQVLPEDQTRVETLKKSLNRIVEIVKQISDVSESHVEFKQYSNSSKMLVLEKNKKKDPSSASD